ncbi:hypothetical protein BD779DRAFT_1707913 [Infundibulicybe gibba]|nr:hypothetical protein BD779DRAFT_1707913 [Infundibulicybe gibba]
MDVLTRTIDDASPLINYQPVGSWQQTVADAAHQNQYYADTLTTTFDQMASASFSFNGTSITIYGSKGTDHGNYTVAIDGRMVDCTGFMVGANASRVPIFTADGLHPVLHTVIVTNGGSTALDIDSVTWTSGSGSSSTAGVNTTLVDDGDSSFEYTPEGAWSMKPSNLNLFNGTTGHTTSNQGASVRYMFTVRSAISLYGTVGPQNSAYNVTLDDWPMKTLNATRAKYEPQTLLYYADNIGHGAHTLTLINAGDMNVDIDYAILRQSVPRYAFLS